ncbi:hypothetical protein FOBRF1_007194 [Fusarium oxysporum]
MLKKVQAVESQLSDDAQLKKHRLVGVVVDNATRWLSQFSMIERALVLRPFYNSFVQRASNEWEKVNLTRAGHIKKGSKLPFFLKEENRMTADDWHVLGTLYDILLDFQLVVRGLEGDGQGKHRRKVEENEIDPPLSVLHPAYRWALFDDLWGDDDERQLWITKAKEMVQDLWEREYRDLEVDDPEIELPANKRLKTSRNKFTAWRTKKRGLTAGGISVTESPIQSPAQSPRSSAGGLDLDEYEQWQRDIEDADASIPETFQRGAQGTLQERRHQPSVQLANVNNGAQTRSNIPSTPQASKATSPTPQLNKAAYDKCHFPERTTPKKRTNDMVTCKIPKLNVGSIATRPAKTAPNPVAHINPIGIRKDAQNTCLAQVVPTGQPAVPLSLTPASIAANPSADLVQSATFSMQNCNMTDFTTLPKLDDFYGFDLDAFLESSAEDLGDFRFNYYLSDMDADDIGRY